MTSERGGGLHSQPAGGAGGHPEEECEGSAFPQTSINTTEMDGNPALLPRWLLLNGREPLVLPPGISDMGGKEHSGWKPRISTWSPEHTQASHSSPAPL